MFHVKHCVRKFRLKKWSCVFRWYKGFITFILPYGKSISIPYLWSKNAIYQFFVPFTYTIYHFLPQKPVFWLKIATEYLRANIGANKYTIRVPCRHFVLSRLRLVQISVQVVLVVYTGVIILLNYRI